MPVTGLRGRQILDGDIVRADLNTTTSGSAVTRRIVAGTNITISSTGVDTGTGDVTINASTPTITLQNLPEAWIKDSVRVATTANITLSGTQTIDGIAVVAGDRVLVKNQSTASQNGIYVVAAGAWARSADADTATEIASSMVAVDEGTSNGGTTWDTDFKSTDTIGTTSMSWFRMLDTGYGQALTKTDDTNVTLTLGGTPATALIQPVSLTLGWSGQLSVGRGGTGASTLTGVLIGNGTNAVTAVAGTASQLLRRNAGNTAYEFFTHTFASTTGATFTGQISTTLAWNATFGNGQILLNGTTGNRIEFNAQGVAAPAFTTRSAGTKLLLYPQIDATNVDYAIGMESGTIWHSVPQASGYNFKWYGGTTQLMALEGNVLKVGGFYWSAGVELIGSDGSANYIKSGTTLYFQAGATMLGRLSNVANMIIGSDSTYYSRLTLYSSAAGQSIDGLSIVTRNTTAAITHITRIYTDTANTTGNGRSLIYAASPNTSNTGGQLDVLIESGGQFISRLGTNQSGTYAYSIYNSAGVENVRIDTGGHSWLMGGNVTIGNSSNVSKLYVNNTNNAINTLRIDTISAAASLQTQVPFQINDYYNSGANGHQLYFNSTAASGVWEYNITKNYGGILTFGMSNDGTTLKRDLYIYGSGQLRFANYTTTTSFAGTAVGYLAFTSDGSIITTAAPSGSSQWITTGSDIYYSAGNVGIGTSTGLTSNKLSIAFSSGIGIKLIATGVTTGILSQGANIEFYKDATPTKAAAIGMSVAGQALGDDFVVSTYNGSAWSRRMTIESTYGNVLIGLSATTASSYILEMQGSAPRVTLRGTSNGSNVGYRYDARDSGGVQRSGGIYFVPDTGSLSYIGLAANDSNYAFIARQNGYCGIGQTNPQAKLHVTCGAGENGLQIDCSNSFEILFGGNNIANIYHGDLNQPLYINTNGGAIYMGTASAGATFQITSSTIIGTIPLVLQSVGSHLKITGGTTDSGIFQGANNLLFLSDWNTGLNGIVVDVGNGILYTRGSSANGSYITFQRSGTTIYGYVGNSAQLGAAGYNSNTDMAIRSEGGINFLTTSGNPLARLQSTGQLRLTSYTATTSFTGTAVGYLAFDSSGNILTTAAPSGSSQWTTNGSDIYYNTGNVGFGATTPQTKIHILVPNQSSALVRFEQTSQRTYEIGNYGNTQAFIIRDVSATLDRFGLFNTGQFRFYAYTAYNSFSNTDAQGILGFDTNGQIITLYAPIYRHTFVTDPVTANNVPSNVSFFASSNAYVTEMDLTGKKRARLIARVTTAATAGTILRVRYAATFSTTASSYLLMGTSEIQVAISSTGIINSGWIDLVAGAKIGVCYIALQTIGGDGATDPVCAQVVFEAEE